MKGLTNLTRPLALSILQQNILIGIILGDGHLEKQKGSKNYRLKIHQNDKHKDYVFHLYDIFQDFTKTPPRSKVVSAFNKTYESWYFNTTVHPDFMDYGINFYNDGKKVLPNPALLASWLSPIGLAYWYMDDGSLKSKESKGVLLNTQNFSLTEVELLCNILEEKLQLSNWPRKQKEGYQIYISGHSYERLKDLISPYLLPSMFYKFPTPRHK